MLNVVYWDSLLFVILDVLPIKAILEKGRCSYTGDTTVWRLSLYSPLAALHGSMI